MSKKMLTAAGIGLALIGVAGVPLHASAHDQHAPVQSTAVETNSMTVVRDAETGQLRAPTAAEHAAMEQAKAAKARNFRVSPKPTLPKYHSSGARGARLTDEFMNASIAVHKADGTIETQCLDSHEDAEAAKKAASTTATIKQETE